MSIPQPRMPAGETKRRGRARQTRERAQGECMIEGCWQDAVCAGFCKPCYSGVRYHMKKGPKHLTTYGPKIGRLAMRAGFIMEKIGRSGGLLSRAMAMVMGRGAPEAKSGNGRNKKSKAH